MIQPQKIFKMSDTPQPTRLIEPDRISIDKLIIRSQEVFDFLKESEDPTDSLIRATIAGSLALRRAQSTIDADFLSKEINQMLNRVRENLTTLIDPLSENSLGRKLSELFKSQGSGLQALLSQGKTASVDLEKKIAEFSGTLHRELNKSISDQMSNGSGKLGTALSQLRSDISTLRDTVIAEKAERRSSAPLIGRGFEETCQAVLEEFCHAHSLILEDVRMVSGIDKSKKGDYCISGGQIKPVVVEMKNRDAKIPLKSILKELSEAVQNRNSEIGIFVGTNCIPTESSPLNSYGEDRLIVCEAEVFKIALRIGLSKARLQYESSKSESGFDIKKCQEALHGIKQTLSNLISIKAHCSVITKNSAKIEETLKTASSLIEMNADFLLKEMLKRD